MIAKVWVEKFLNGVCQCIDAAFTDTHARQEDARQIQTTRCAERTTGTNAQAVRAA